jgi:hypothetical protein
VIRPLRAGVAGVILAATPAAALAHDTFLISSGRLVAGQPILLGIGSGRFPDIETGLRPERIARIRARAADTPLISAPATGDRITRLTLDWPAATPAHQNGIVVAVDLTPIPILVDADEIEHYLDEIGAPPDVAAAARAAVARDGAMRETYTKHLKLLACIATCDGLAPSRPTGAALEFVAADEGWRLLENGQPRGGQAVFVSTPSQGRRRLTTDRSGLIVLPDDLTGPVFLSAVALTPPAEPGGPFTSDWATLTIDASVR